MLFPVLSLVPGCVPHIEINFFKRQAFEQERLYRGIGELALCPLYDQAGAAEAGAGGEATSLRAGAPL
jgi:hypothetical protein